MKKVLFALMLLISCASFAQKHTTFCEIVGTGKLLSNKVKVQIDFGQATPYFKSYQTFLVDENGKKIEFNSMVDAMNQLAKLGWKFEQAYVITVDQGVSKQNVYHWLLSKEIESDEEVREGIMTEQDFKNKD